MSASWSATPRWLIAELSMKAGTRKMGGEWGSALIAGVHHRRGWQDQKNHDTVKTRMRKRDCQVRADSRSKGISKQEILSESPEYQEQMVQSILETIDPYVEEEFEKLGPDLEAEKFKRWKDQDVLLSIPPGDLEHLKEAYALLGIREPQLEDEEELGDMEKHLLAPEEIDRMVHLPGDLYWQQQVTPHIRTEEEDEAHTLSFAPEWHDVIRKAKAQVDARHKKAEEDLEETFRQYTAEPEIPPLDMTKDVRWTEDATPPRDWTRDDYERFIGYKHVPEPDFRAQADSFVPKYSELRGYSMDTIEFISAIGRWDFEEIEAKSSKKLEDGAGSGDGSESQIRGSKLSDDDFDFETDSVFKNSVDLSSTSAASTTYKDLTLTREDTQKSSKLSDMDDDIDVDDAVEL